METFSTRQLAVIAAANKTVSWLFRITDNLFNTYYWSTGTQASSGSETVLFGALMAPGAYTGSEWERAHTFKIVNFSGITLRRGKSESGIHAPNDVSFSIVNSGNALDAVNFSGGTVRIGLVIDDGSGKELCGSWRFRIKSASPYSQQIDVTCEDFLQEFLTGSYPNTRLISDIFPVADGVAPDTMCIPEPYGTCYIPLRSVYAGAARYYILGDPANTFTIDEVRSPRTLGAKIVWTSAGFTFQQSTVSSWRMFQALIAEGNPGIFMSGDRILDVPTKFSRSDTAAVTGPSEIIRRVLRNMGLADYDLDLTSFDAAAATFAGWSLAWNFAFYYKEDRRVVLSRLLAMCHCALIIGEKVSLQVLSKTSQATVTNASVLKMQEVGQDTFRYTDAIAERVSDSGYVAFQQTGESQDQFLRALVPAKSATDVRDAEVITFPGVQDTQQVQKLGTLYYQRKFLKAADISFTGKGTLLALRPDDVITINYADYGGTYNVLIDEITINPDVSVSINAIRFSEVLDDWGDLAPGAITIASDTPTTAYSPVIAGPDGTTPSSGNLPNSLPGRLRVGQTTNYILLDPASPLRVSLYSADVERLRIGNLNGYLGYVADTYGLAIGSAAKYLKYDPTSGLRLGGGGVARIELDLELARISVKDATDATKTAMGYLNGLAKHDGTGNWGPGDYGFWAAAGDHLKIDGDTIYESGDWIVENDGAYLINNAADQTIVRLGTVSGVKGLYIYDAETVQNLLAKFATDGLYLGLPGETTSYLKYTLAGGLVIRGGLNADDITTGTLSANRLSIISGLGAALNFDPSCTNIENWEGVYTGLAEIATIPDGIVGAKALRCLTSQDSGHLSTTELIPVDRLKTYRVSALIRKSSGADGDTYLGLWEYDSTGADLGTSLYAAFPAILTTNFVRYSGTIIPANFDGLTRYVRISIILGYLRTTGYVEAQDIRLEEVIPASLVVDGAITAVKIGASAVTADKIDAGAVTAAKLSFSTLAGLNSGEGSKLAGIAAGADVTLSAINGGLSITGGGITLNAAGAIKGGQTAYVTGTGFFLGYESAAYKFSVGDTSKYLRWDGSALTIGGDIVATGNIQSAAVTGAKLPDVAAGDNTIIPNIAFADTDVDRTTPQKLKEIQINRAGTLRVIFQGSVATGTADVSYWRVYKNGSAIGTQYTTIGVKTQDLSGFVSGDLVQIYAWMDNPSGSGILRVTNFYIKFDDPLIAVVTL